MQQHPAALHRKAPGRQNRLAFGARPQPLGDAIDKQIDDLVLAQVPLGERLVILPQPLPKLRYRGLRQQKPAILVLEGIFDVAHRQPTRQHLDRQILEPLRVTLEMLANGRAERLIPPGDLWRRILHHPSAVFSRPVRYPFRYPWPGCAPCS